MLKSEEGIIIRTVKYAETSVILDILTSEDGIKSFIIGGIRKKGIKSKAPLVRVLNLVKFEAYYREGDRLSRIKEIAYSYVYSSIPFDVVKASIATFLIEVCRKAVRASDDYKGVYNFIIKGLIHLDKSSSDISNFHILFLINFAKNLGFEISDNFSSENQFFDLKEGCFKPHMGDHRYMLDQEMSCSLHKYLAQSNLQELTRIQRKAILLKMVDYYKYHIEGFGELKSLGVLISLYED